MATDNSTSRQPPFSRYTSAFLRIVLACAGYTLIAAGVVLAAWAFREGIESPPWTRPAPLISRLGLQAGLVCGLLGYTCVQIQRALKRGRPGTALGYLGLIPSGIAAVVGTLLLLDWLEH